LAFFTRLLGDIFSRRVKDPDATRAAAATSSTELAVEHSWELIFEDGPKSAMAAVDDDDSVSVCGNRCQFLEMKSK